MPEIEDFLKLDVENQIKTAFEEGRHIEWISIRFLLLDQLIKSFLYLSLNPENQDKDNISFIKKSNLGTLIRICSLKGLINNNLRKNLFEFTEKRNLILHNLIMKNEKLEDIDLKNLFNLGNNCNFELVKEVVSYSQKRMISDAILNELKRKIK